MAFGRSLNLDKTAGFVHNDVHVGFGPRILPVIEVEDRLTVEYADRNGRNVAVQRVPS